jgi:hypothetical protein
MTRLGEYILGRSVRRWVPDRVASPPPDQSSDSHAEQQ